MIPDPERQPFSVESGRLARLSGYTGLFLSAALRNFGMSLISLFIPLYVWRLTGNLRSVFLFYALYHLVVVLVVYPTAKFIRRFGVDLVGFLGAVTRAFFLYCLVRAEARGLFLWAGGIWWGVTVPLSWLTFHYSFIIAEKEDGKYGKEVSQLQVVYRLTGLLGPAAGGVITTLYGFGALFTMVMVVTIVSGLPLFFDAVADRGMRLSWEKIVSHLRRQERQRVWWSLVGGQLEATVMSLAWPLFIFTVVADYETIGFIKSASAVVAVGIVWSLGRLIDRKAKSVLRFGSIVNSFNLLIRSFLTGSVPLFLADASYGVASGLVATPFEAAFYEEAVKMRKLEFVVEREVVLHASGAVICLLIGFLVWLSVDWFWLFALGAVGLFLQNMIFSPVSKS